MISLSVPPGSTVCSGQEVILEGDILGVEPVDYYWEAPDGVFPVAELTTYPEGDGEYIFNVVDACGSVATASLFIETEDYEPMQVLWPPVEGYACIGEEDMIVPDVQGGAGELIFDWYVNGGEVVGQNIPVMYTLTDQTGMLEYEMVVTDECGNELSYFFYIDVIDCGTPNAFTPNGDGNNDYLYMDFGTMTDGAHMEIFNRWEI